MRLLFLNKLSFDWFVVHNSKTKENQQQPKKKKRITSRRKFVYTKFCFFFFFQIIPFATERKSIDHFHSIGIHQKLFILTQLFLYSICRCFFFLFTVLFIFFFCIDFFLCDAFNIFRLILFFTIEWRMNRSNPLTNRRPSYNALHLDWD